MVPLYSFVIIYLFKLLVSLGIQFCAARFYASIIYVLSDNLYGKCTFGIV